MATNSISILFLLTLIPLLKLASCQVQGFTNPPEYSVDIDVGQNPVYTVGNQLNITWRSIEQPVNLVLWQCFQNGSDCAPYQSLPDSTNLTKDFYDWDPITVDSNDTPNFDLAVATAFRLGLFVTGDTAFSGLSIYFNLSTNTIDAQSSAIPSPTPTPTSKPSNIPESTTSSTSSPVSPTAATIPSPTPSPASTGISTGVKVGIGLGCFALFALIIGVTGIFLWVRSKKNGNGKESVEPMSSPYPAQDYTRNVYANGAGNAETNRSLAMNGGNHPRGTAAELPESYAR